MSNRTRPSAGRTVAVYGAYGHTGRFVVDELLRRGLRVIASGRDAARLEAAFRGRPVEVRAATIDDAGSLASAIAGADALVNCAGPFLDTAIPVIEAALKARVHYIDVAPEQASAQAVLDRFDAPARQAGIVVMPAMAFYGGFADLMATAASSGLDGLDELRIAIALDAWWPTQGTRQTGRRNTAPRVVVEGGQLVPNVAGAPFRWDFPPPFGAQDVVENPFSEIVLIHRHLPAARVRTCLNTKPLADLKDPETPPPQAADASGRSSQRFLVEVVARSGQEERRIAAGGRDIYAFTAPLVVQAVDRVLSGAGAAGAVTPGQHFPAADFLEALRGELDTYSVG